MSVPPWLQRHLQETGRWNADGVARRAVLRTHICGDQVIIGLDNEPCGMVAICDPRPLSTIGEALALLAGRATYGLWTIPYLHLERRVDQWVIAGTPAGSNAEFDVVAAHVCDADPLPTAPSVLAPPASVVMAHEPPF